MEVLLSEKQIFHAELKPRRHINVWAQLNKSLTYPDWNYGGEHIKKPRLISGALKLRPSWTNTLAVAHLIIMLQPQAQKLLSAFCFSDITCTTAKHRCAHKHSFVYSETDKETWNNLYLVLKRRRCFLRVYRALFMEVLWMYKHLWWRIFTSFLSCLPQCFQVDSRTLHLRYKCTPFSLLLAYSFIFLFLPPVLDEAKTENTKVQMMFHLISWAGVTFFTIWSDASCICKFWFRWSLW